MELFRFKLALTCSVSRKKIWSGIGKKNKQMVILRVIMYFIDCTSDNLGTHRRLPQPMEGQFLVQRRAICLIHTCILSW